MEGILLELVISGNAELAANCVAARSLSRGVGSPFGEGFPCTCALSSSTRTVWHPPSTDKALLLD